jgi:hypothetical protein
MKGYTARRMLLQKAAAAAAAAPVSTAGRGADEERTATDKRSDPDERPRSVEFAPQWAALYEAVLPPERPTVARAHLLEAVRAAVAASPDAPRHGFMAVLVEAHPVPDGKRAPRWPFVDRLLRVRVYAGADSVPSDAGSSGARAAPTTTVSIPGGPSHRVVRLVRRPWEPNEAIAYAIDLARRLDDDGDDLMEAEAARARPLLDYDPTALGMPMALYLTTTREHAQGQRRARPPAPSKRDAVLPDGRPIFAGWIPASPDDPMPLWISESYEVLSMRLRGLL